MLFATRNFFKYTNIPLVADFIMEPIPVSYLNAGQVRFMDNGSTIYWSISWGGASFTGSTVGNIQNDNDGTFGPPVSIALPSNSLQALLFTRSTLASAESIANVTDYSVTAGAAVFINNANTSFTVVAGSPGDFNDDGKVDNADYIVWRKTLGTNFNLGGNGDENGTSFGIVDNADYNYWRLNFGETAAGSGGGTPIPEPASSILLLASIFLVSRRRIR